MPHFFTSCRFSSFLLTPPPLLSSLLKFALAHAALEPTLIPGTIPFFSYFALFHAPNAQCLTQIHVSFAPRSFFCVLTILLFPFHFLPKVALITLSGKGYMREIKRSTNKWWFETRRPLATTCTSLLFLLVSSLHLLLQPRGKN